MIGNVRDSPHAAPKVIHSMLPKSDKIPAKIGSGNNLPNNAGVNPNLTKADISGFECSYDIWNKKALERCPGRKNLPSLMTLRVPQPRVLNDFQNNYLKTMVCITKF